MLQGDRGVQHAAANKVTYGRDWEQLGKALRCRGGGARGNYCYELRQRSGLACTSRRRLCAVLSLAANPICAQSTIGRKGGLESIFRFGATAFMRRLSIRSERNWLLCGGIVAAFRFIPSLSIVDVFFLCLYMYISQAYLPTQCGSPALPSWRHFSVFFSECLPSVIKTLRRCLGKSCLLQHYVSVVSCYIRTFVDHHMHTQISGQVDGVKHSSIFPRFFFLLRTRACRTSWKPFERDWSRRRFLCQAWRRRGYAWRGRSRPGRRRSPALGGRSAATATLRRCIWLAELCAKQNPTCTRKRAFNYSA